MAATHFRQHVSWERITNWSGLLILLSLALVWPAAFAVEPGEELPARELRAPELPARVQSGSLLLKSASDAPAVEAMRVHTGFRAEVTGNIARVQVSQQFTNPSDDWVEGLYVFPLSADSAVDELLMHVGERVIRGDIQPRDKARAAYETARSEGRRASLVDQERPNMFTTSVANIAPHSSITVEIAYLETIARRDGRYTLRLPLAITPRYNPGFGTGTDPASPMAARLAHAASSVLGVNVTPERVTSPQQQVSIDIQLAPGFPLQTVESLHHQIATTSDDRAVSEVPAGDSLASRSVRIPSGDSLGRHISLKESDLPADRDFELVWTPAVMPDVQAAVFAEHAGAETYAMLMLTPPQQQSRSVERREVEFIIDTSGSMEGPSIEQARAALQMGVDRLSSGDRFNIIRFSNTASSLYEEPQPVSEASRALASHFIASLRAAGGTEMQPPLELAFATAPTDGLLRQIVFITDGSVGNEAQIISLIRKNIGDARLFTVGIGGSPNAFFLQEAATAGRGSYTYIAEREQVRARMEDLFRKIESPALVDLSVQWPGSAKSELAAPVPGDLYAGDPLVVLARVTGLPAANQVLTLSGRTHGIAWVQQIPIVSVTQQAGIAKLWARERIGALVRQRNFGGDAAEAQAAITEISLQHHVVSEFTSLVAVDDSPARPPGVVDRSEQAPTSAPAGSYWANTTGFAKTATAAPLTLLIGLACFAVAALLYFPIYLRPGHARRFGSM
jgi:Ca-activated chloride channel family protein